MLPYVPPSKAEYNAGLNHAFELYKQLQDAKDTLAIARDHLAQYRRYSEEMRAIGRGASIYSEWGEESLDKMMDEVLGPGDYLKDNLPRP